MQENSNPLRVAVIGAGVAGAAAARKLVDAGGSVAVFDRGRRPGGRCTTRLGNAVSFDHGAPCFTIGEEAFAKQVAAWRERGVVERWSGRFATVRGDGSIEAASRERWVGVPGMDALVRDLLEGIDCRSGVAVTGLRRDASGWQLATDSGSIDDRFDNRFDNRFDEVVVAMPPVQAARLLGDTIPGALEVLGRATFRPRWTAMIGIEAPVDLPFDAATVEDQPILAWLARESGKPGRPTAPPESWVVHARGDWSEPRLEVNRDEIADELFDAFAGLVDGLGLTVPETRELRGHRWTFALCERALDTPHWRDDRAGFTLCGDWLLGAGIEHAFLSGTSAAEVVLDHAP